MLDVGTDEVRLFLHLLAATIWVGGQLVLAGLVHPLRALSPDAPAAAANAFARIAWPAYAVLVLTGIWNIAAVDATAATGEYRRVLVLKLVVVALSGATALAHSRARSRRGLAVFGALTGLTALLALLLGVLLRG